MGLNLAGAALALTMLMAAGGTSFAEVPGSQAMAAAPVTKPSSRPVTPFVPGDFDVPTLVETPEFKIVPLGPDLARIDYAAYMSSIEHLQKTFTRSADWPHEDITDSDAMRDMEAEQSRFRARKSFAYAVVTPDGLRERGCVYIYPGSVEPYDAEVRMWVTKEELDAGFDAKLYEWVVNWVRTDWPFANVAYPGRAIEWGTWDALVAASKARKAGSEEQKH